MNSLSSKINILMFLFTVLIPLCETGCGTTQSSMKINTRPGVTLKFYLNKPDNPIAAIVIFPGGDGIVDFSSSYPLPSIASYLQKHGFIVAYIDAPSDHREQGMDQYFRASNEHAQDIEAVVTHLRKELDIPIWFVGHSRGTIDAAIGATRFNENIDGLVLMAGVVWIERFEMELHRIKIPTLLIYHKDDPCPGTSPSVAERLKSGLVTSPRVELKFFTGGRYERMHNLCGSGPHQFRGNEKKVAAEITEFIKSSSQ